VDAVRVGALPLVCPGVERPRPAPPDPRGARGLRAVAPKHHVEERGDRHLDLVIKSEDADYKPPKMVTDAASSLADDESVTRALFPKAFPK
jgi:hypothetical protein